MRNSTDTRSVIIPPRQGAEGIKRGGYVFYRDNVPFGLTPGGESAPGADGVRCGRRQVVDDLRDGDGFEDHVAEPELHTFILRVDVGGNGDDVERFESGIGAEFLKQDAAVHFGHPQIGQDQVERPHLRTDLPERVPAVHGSDDVGYAVLAEHGAQDRDVQRDIVDDQDMESFTGLAVEIDPAAGTREAVGTFGEPDVRDADDEDRPSARFGLQRDGPVHAVNEVTADGDAETGAGIELAVSRILRYGFDRPHEAVPRLPVHAAAGIGDSDHEEALVRAGFAFESEFQGDLAFLGELDGIVEQMEEYLPHPLRIDLEIRHVFVPFA